MRADIAGRTVVLGLLTGAVQPNSGLALIVMKPWDERKTKETGLRAIYDKLNQEFASLGAANWAVMVRENASGILLNPAAVLAPSLAIGLLAVSVNSAVTAFAGERPI